MYVEDLAKQYLNLEDEYRCSGMCRPSLFYFQLNLTEFAHPENTCLHDLKNYMAETGVPYSTTCILMCLVSFWLSLSVCLM